MPQDKKKNPKAKRAAKASIKLRESARSQKNPVLRKIADTLADKQLAKAMKLNKETREVTRKSRKK